MLMRPNNKAETAVHDCYCPGDMAVYMRKVLARPRVGVRVCHLLLLILIGSLSTRVFETRTATGREHFACLDPIVTQIFILPISNGEKILGNVYVYAM